MNKVLTLYKNPGLFCAQACMKSVLKYYYPKKNFSLRELAGLSYKKRKGLTYTSGIALALDKLGLNVKGYTKKLDLDKEFARKAKEKKLMTIKRLKIKDLKKFLKKKYLIILLLNWNVIKNKKKYNGHFVILNEMGSKIASVMNVGPKKPNIDYKIPLNKLNKAWHAKGTDSDAIIIRGSKCAF